MMFHPFRDYNIDHQSVLLLLSFFSGASCCTPTVVRSMFRALGPSLSPQDLLKQMSVEGPGLLGHRYNFLGLDWINHHFVDVLGRICLSFKLMLFQCLKQIQDF